MSETLERERGWMAENMKVMPKVMGKDERRGRWAESRASRIWGAGRWTGGRKTRNVGFWKQGESALRRRKVGGSKATPTGPREPHPERFGGTSLKGDKSLTRGGSQNEKQGDRRQ